jgi:hypothetical protein
MEKYPRSGPLFDAMFKAVSEVNSLGNVAGTPGGINEGESLESIYKRVAKKYEVPLDLLKKADNNFDDVFESRMIEAPYKGLGEMNPAAKAAQQPRMIEAPYKGLGEMSPAAKAAQQAQYERLIEQSRPIDKRLIEKMIPAAKTAGKAGQSTEEAYKNLAKKAYKIPDSIVGKATTSELSTLEKLLRPAGGALAAAVEAIPAIEKYSEKNPTASLTEAALSPEGSKGIARGLGAMAGLEAGAELGGMSPVAKGPASLVGAVGGSIVGAKLGELLTGVPQVDALIRKAYEKQLRRREAKMVEQIKASAK